MREDLGHSQAWSPWLHPQVLGTLLLGPLRDRMRVKLGLSTRGAERRGGVPGRKAGGRPEGPGEPAMAALGDGDTER